MKIHIRHFPVLRTEVTDVPDVPEGRTEGRTDGHGTTTRFPVYCGKNRLIFPNSAKQKVW